MYRTTKIKQTIVILVFFLIIVLSFIAGLRYLNYIQNKNIYNNYLYTLSKEEYNKTLENNGNLNINVFKLMTENNYHEQYLKSFLPNIIFVTIIFFGFVLIILFGLWLILNNIRKKELKQVLNDLDMIFDNNNTHEDPFLNLAYKRLHQKFDDRLNDYKRLNAYLSHDQKNTLAVLRAEVELSNNIKTLKNLDNLSDSIDNVLTLSENIEPTLLLPVDISLICAEACDNYRKIFKEIYFDFEENNNTEIMARERWIYRAIANLLDNAIKYGNNKPIHVCVKEEKGSVIVTVEDSGIGISEEEQNKIFDDRYRVSELNKKGYGLGLSLVCHVCDLCGGFISVDSILEKGTKFYLAFPKKI